jgi:hypothetical protein
MATDTEILDLWNNPPIRMKKEEAIISFYHQARKAGAQEGMLALEQELLTDATIETALKTFGWGRGRKESLIATRAVLRGAIQIAIGKLKNKM